VPFGPFHIQAKWSMTVAYGNPHDVYASAHGTLDSTSAPAGVTADFGGYGRVQVGVTGAGSDPVEFRLDGLGSSGPLGMWSDAVLQPPSAFQFDFVPPGAVRAVVRQAGQAGMATDVLGTVPGPSGHPELVVTAPLGNAREFGSSGAGTIDGWGDDGFRYPIDGSGKIVEGGLEFMTPSLAATLHNAAELALDGAAVCCSPAARVDDTLGGSLLTLAPMTNYGGRGLVVTRKVWIPSAGGVVAGDAGGFAQILDVIHNQAATTVNVTVRLTSIVDGAQEGQRSVLERSASLVSDGAYFVVGGDQDGTVFGVSAYVLSGASPPIAPSVISSDFRRTHAARTEWKLTLAPGQKAALLHFVLQRLPGVPGGAIARARALVTDVVAAGNTLVGLTDEERQIVINFRLR
jgi:hypothetical protein